MEVLPGAKSTEFKALVGTLLLALSDGTVPKEVLDMDPGVLKLFILAGVVYGISRTVVKVMALKYATKKETL